MIFRLYRVAVQLAFITNGARLAWTLRWEVRPPLRWPKVSPLQNESASTDRPERAKLAPSSKTILSRVGP